MEKICIWIALISIFIPTELYSKEPYLKRPEAFFTENKLVIVIKLLNGLDIDRMSIIEKGITVKLTYLITIYQKNLVFFDELLTIDSNTQFPLNRLFITKELTYDYITKNYTVKVKKNYSSKIDIKKFYAGENLKESYNILKKKFFNKKVVINIDLSRIKLKKKSYYVTVKSTFSGVKTFDFPFRIPNPFNFVASEIESKVFKQ